MTNHFWKYLLQFWIGFAILALAYSILQISKTINNVNQNVPDIVKQVALVNQNIDSLSQKTIPDILEAVPPITKEVNQLQARIPAILKEIDEIQSKTIPDLLVQSNSISQQIPNILERIDSIDKRIPASLATVEQALQRVDSLQKQLPLILHTVKETNDSISSYMAIAQNMMLHADEIADEMGRNASIGFLGGIVSSPFHAVKGIGNFVFGKNSELNKEDAVEVEKLLTQFLNENSKKKERKWKSEKINKTGTFTIVKTYRKKDQLIKKVQIHFDKYDEDLHVEYFQDHKSKLWYFLK